MKKDVYQVVTDRIIALLESGTIPWQKPWKGGDQVPRNFVNRKAYRGINPFFLNAAGFASPFWLTFRQAQSLGGRVKKGEQSSPVVFWKILEKVEHGETEKIPFLRYHSVFNVAQCEGMSVPALPEIHKEFCPIEKCAEVVAHMLNPPTILQHGHRACYSPILDTIAMPDSKLFVSSEAYYGTLFHELTHSTGHASRLFYYKALQDSHTGAVDCRPFISFMLEAIGNSLYKYIDVATESRETVREDVPANVPANNISDKILILVRANPNTTAQKMALALGVAEKTIKRHLKSLRKQGRLKRVGSDKAGHWEVIKSHPNE